MNPAQHVLDVYDCVIGHSQDANKGWAAVWGDVFEIAGSTPDFEDEITRCLQALHSEIDLARAGLRALGVPDELTEPGFRRLRDVASPALLRSQCGGHRGNIVTPENRVALQWAAWALRDENNMELDASAAAELEGELLALESAVDVSDLSQPIKAFIRQQTSTIRRALRLRLVTGGRGLREALQQASSDLAFDGAELREDIATASPEGRGLIGRALGTIKKAGELSDSIEKIGKAAERIGKVVAPMLPLIGKMVDTIGKQ